MNANLCGWLLPSRMQRRISWEILIHFQSWSPSQMDDIGFTVDLLRGQWDREGKLQEIMNRGSSCFSISSLPATLCICSFLMTSGVEGSLYDLAMPLNSSLHLGSMTKCIVYLTFCPCWTVLMVSLSTSCLKDHCIKTNCSILFGVLFKGNEFVVGQ